MSVFGSNINTHFVSALLELKVTRGVYETYHTHLQKKSCKPRRFLQDNLHNSLKLRLGMFPLDRALRERRKLHLYFTMHM